MSLEGAPYTTEMIYNDLKDSYKGEGSYQDIFKHLQVSISTRFHEFDMQLFLWNRPCIPELFEPGHFVGLGLGLRLKSEIRTRISDSDSYLTGLPTETQHICLVVKSNFDVPL
jgi:hypothetical protein